MGRALYSTRYTSVVEPVIAEPAEHHPPTPYSRWSKVTNNFDPDSEEFFVDAQYEAFVDPNSLPPHQLDSRASSPAVFSDISSSSASSEDGGAVGSGESEETDPALLMARVARSDPEWATTILRLGRAMDQRQNRPRVTAANVTSAPQPLRVSNGSTRPITTSLSPDEETNIDRNFEQWFNQGARREVDSATPTGQDTPTVRAAAAPSTPMPIPPPMVRGGGAHIAPEVLMGTPQSFQMTPPSPVSVSPRLLSWGRTPASVRGGGPLSSSSARVSVSAVPVARVRVQGFAA